MNEYFIHYLPLSEIRKNEQYISKWISMDRLLKANSYKNEDDKLRSIGAAYFIHKYLKDNITINEYGKPHSNNGYFNISHSGCYVVFIQSDCECGIDIEKRDIISNQLVNYVFNEEDKKLLNTINDFNKYWTIKESIVKARAIGLSSNSIKDIPCNIGLNTFMGKTYITKSIELYSYSIGIAIETTEDYTIKLIEEIIE